jgi:PTH1 family peptidyl-tRNA hydrolase
MILITGLGNPGKEFLKTRHNVGFDIIDSIHSEFNFPKFSEKFNSLYSKKTIYDKIIVIQKPMSYMNLSGGPIKKIFNFFKINDTQDIFVFHDDLDIEFSSLNGGHNGIKSIMSLIGPNFNRIKFGIKNSLYKEKNIDAEKFVLDKFNLEELKMIETIKKKIIINFELLIKKDFSSFKNNF